MSRHTLLGSVVLASLLTLSPFVSMLSYPIGLTATSSAFDLSNVSEGQSQRLTVPGADPSTAQYFHCNTTGTSIIPFTQSKLQADFMINKGQSFVISNQVVNMQNYNFILNGGILIIENSTIRGYGSGWEVQRASCAEVTDSSDFVSADSINVGGNPPPLLSSRDNSSLFVNHSTMLPGIQITGRDVTLRIIDSVFQDNIFFNGWVTGWPTEAGETKMYVSNSVIPTIALAFGGPSEGGNINHLEGGHFEYWNLHQNLTVNNLPYDLTLNNVTLIPNHGGEGNGLGGGWGVQLLPGGSSGTQWPSLTVRNSDLGFFAFFWGCCISSASFSDLGLRYPVTQTIFGTITLVNTTVEGTIDIGCSDCNLTFTNDRGLGLFPSGRSALSIVNSYTGQDAFNPTNCVCNATFSGNSSLGRPTLIDFSQLPEYRILPNASWWQSLGGAAFVVNSVVRISGNFTNGLVGPGRPQPGSNYFPTNSTVTRTYPVVVTDASGHGISGAIVTLSTPSGTILRSSLTGNGGRTDIPVSFLDSNYTGILVLKASKNDMNNATHIGLVTRTPLFMTLSQPSTTSTTTTSSTTSRTTPTTAGRTTAQTTSSSTLSTTSTTSTFPILELALGAVAAVVVVGLWGYFLRRHHS